MSGTVAGGKKAAATNMKKYGKDFYKKNGKKGGQNGHTGGFYANHELARIAGAKGGKKSSRAGVRNGEGKTKPKAKKKEEVKYHEIVEIKKTGILGRLFGRKNG